MASTELKLPAMHNTLGALYIGVILSMGLWGAGSIQAFYYYQRYPKDDIKLKLLVGSVWILDTLHQGFISHTCYSYLVTHYADPAYLNVLVSTILYEVIVSGILCFLVQTFFVYRVWRLSHESIPLVTILYLLVAAEFILTMIYAGQALQLGTFTNLHKIVNLSRVINIFAAVSDVAIAAALIWLLHCSRTGFRRSDSMINRLIMFTMNTGLLTSLDALTSLITITVLPNTFVYILFFFALSRLYTNSLLATLNARVSSSDCDKNTSYGESGDELSLSAAGRFRSRAVEIDTTPNLNYLGGHHDGLSDSLSKKHLSHGGGAGGGNGVSVGGGGGGVGGGGAGGVQAHTVSIKVKTETETLREVKNGISSDSESELPHKADDFPDIV